MSEPSKILLPGQPAQSQIPGVPAGAQPQLLYQDENYVVMRISPINSLAEKMQIPYHLMQIAVLGIQAKEFVPRIGKDNFIASLATIKKFTIKELNKQRAIATSMTSADKPPKPPIKPQPHHEKSLAETMKEQGIDT